MNGIEIFFKNIRSYARFIFSGLLAAYLLPLVRMQPDELKVFLAQFTPHERDVLAIIGVVFVLGASGAILVLASNPHGGEHLKDLLVGQILWVSPARLPLQTLIYAAILAIWFGLGARLGRIGFYALFACAVTFSVQLVGLYLVFASLVVPALATYFVPRRRLLKAYAVGMLGYASGLLASLWLDLPSGATIVWAMALAGMLAAGLARRPGHGRQRG